MKQSILPIFLVALCFCCIAQDARTKQIDAAIRLINNNGKLILKEIDANEVYGHTFDGGGTIKIYSERDIIVKIEQQIGLSCGRVTTTIYLAKGKPIQVIDREENFPFTSDSTGLDYTKLKQVFEATIYVFNWDQDNSKVYYKGKRVLSEGTCSNFEYEPLIEIARKHLE
jgi:hypothetical protein